MKLYSGQVMWEMRPKQRTQCTVTTGSVTTLVVHSRVCWGLLSKKKVLCKMYSFCLACCGYVHLWAMPVVRCFSSVYAFPRRVAKKLKSNLPFSPGLIYQHGLDGVNQEQINGLQRSTGRGAASFLSDGEGYRTLHSLLNLPFHKSLWVWYYNPLLLFSATHCAWKLIFICSTGEPLEGGG